MSRRFKKAVRRKLAPKPKGGKEGLAKRRIRKLVTPSQKGLKPAYKDGWIFHSHVRFARRGKKSKTFPKGKPMAIVITKFRTMERGAHSDYGIDGRERKGHYTRFGRLARKTHIDEIPQLPKLVTGELKLVGLRPPFGSLYRKLPPELKRIYDEIGSGMLALPYACKSKNPTKEEIIQVANEFYAMWKKNPTRAHLVFSKRILKNSKGKEIVMEEIFK